MNALLSPRHSSAVNTARTRLFDELRRQGIHDESVLAAMAKIPREQFVDHALSERAYKNDALPIGHAQTLSQPYVVALMTAALRAGKKLKKVLEIGTGSGYQTAVLAPLCDTVFTVERIKALTELARKRLAGLGYKNVHFGYADGINGWLPYAPYDGILVTAGAEEIPQPLLQQMADGGRLVIPVGSQGRQSLKLVERKGARYRQTDLGAVSFVPLLGGKI